MSLPSSSPYVRAFFITSFVYIGRPILYAGHLKHHFEKKKSSLSHPCLAQNGTRYLILQKKTFLSLGKLKNGAEGSHLWSASRNARFGMQHAIFFRHVALFEHRRLRKPWVLLAPLADAIVHRSWRTVQVCTSFCHCDFYNFCNFCDFFNLPNPNA